MPARRPLRPPPPPVGAHPGRRRTWRTRCGRWRPRRCAGIDLRAPRRRPPPPGGGRRGALRAPGRAPPSTTRWRPGTGSRRGPARSWPCPCFLYGPERTLPDVRRHAFADAGARRRAGRRPTPRPAPSASAPGRCWSPTTCGWPTASRWTTARRVAAAVRVPGAVRALGLDVGGRAQVSMNLVDPLRVGPADAYDAVRGPGRRSTGPSWWACVPAAVLDAIPPDRWTELDLGRSRTIEEPTPAPQGEPDLAATVTPGPVHAVTWRRRAGRGSPGAARNPRSGRGRGLPAGEGALAADAATFPFAQPAPDTELLAVHQGVLEALLAHHAAPAHRLGLSRRRPPLREEQVGVDAQAVGLALPAAVPEVEPVSPPLLSSAASPHVCGIRPCCTCM